MDVIKDLEMRSLSFIIYWILNALHVSLEEGGRGRFHLSVYPRGLTAEKDLKVLALRTVVMLSEDKEFLQPPGAGRGQEQTPSQREHSPSDTLVFGTVILF